MRRPSIHAVFAALALACGASVLWHGLRWQQAVRLNAAVDAAARLPPGRDAQAPAARDAPPEVRLARATALSAAGAYDAAFKGYSSLVEAGTGDALARQAQYGLANMYQRQAIALGAGEGGTRASGEAGPLVELAKQRYRDLLRAEPGHWDARHNLERALRLAPEEEAAFAEDTDVPVERRRVQLRGMEPGDLP